MRIMAGLWCEEEKYEIEWNHKRRTRDILKRSRLKLERAMMDI